MSDDSPDSPKPIKLEDLKVSTGSGAKPLSEIAKTLAGIGSHVNPAKNLAIRLQEQQDKFSDLLRPSKEAEPLRKRFESLTQPSPAMRSILDQVEGQRRLLDSISKPDAGGLLTERAISAPRMPDFQMPRNPILDTNAQLAEIERKFESMLDVMTNAARIGNDIQAQATTFIGKFEEASSQTDSSAKKAILVGVFALVIATLSPFAPMVVDYFSPNRTVPAIEALTREVVSADRAASADNQKLIEALKKRDDQATGRIVEEVRRRQDETNAILRELIETLKDRNVPANP
ncbi:hypothetical protein LRP31_09215 [Mesorhizobium mediterraneum]|uniref:Uncharacterized protein n=1 Tax=Mesorhizobium mediterraneum TaxID=43617 RepID=A0AB36R5C5_9HYPH|nr:MULTISPECIES: hypothetical protein [Mesorhizobium]PAP99808.1 hypothetical protein CIT25_23390 [Mesorhizobium mediterraneum]RUU97531.1 hypothetical protein EOB36_26635 [Mesorhizobium sp. M6A.T.Cr.TU.017.01.1.1]RWN28471.1 MAG: hypothetical protein EOR96_32720 [Mesorhizobium sp.]WIW55384.1 hypothetical protein LRP31_09215 [Mesorhizobium mediterraneum]